MRYLILLFFVSTAHAGGQHTIPDYNTARDTFFWAVLYADGGHSLYCDITIPPGERLTVEHVYPADWMAEHWGCATRNCGHPSYKLAQADLHNLWPANDRINSSRGDLPFGELPGETSRQFTDFCPDFERSRGDGAVVEPRDEVKGDIARSLFYMHTEYDLDLRGMLPMLKRWNRADPPDEAEYLRNDRIAELEGSRNQFIDDYFLGNGL